jgi:hypothetical protein
MNTVPHTSKRVRALRLAAAASIAAGTLCVGAQAGAQDWAPAQADTYIDLLREPYPSEPGHGPSIHATCAPDGQGVEIGVHPFDEVPRNFQVWDTDPPSPQIILNVNEADWVGVFPFGGLGIEYSGEEYWLVDELTQRALCAAPTTDTSPPVTDPPVTATSAPPETTGPPPSVTAPQVTPTPSTSPVPGVGVTTSSINTNGFVCLDPTQACGTGVLRSGLPTTGRDNGPLLVVAGCLIVLGSLAVLTGKALRRARRITFGDEDGAR